MAPCVRCRFPAGRKECPSCTAGLYGGEKFCPFCGTCFGGHALLAATRVMKTLEPFLPERALERILSAEAGLVAERKYATVVFAEIAGLSALGDDAPAEKVAEAVNAVLEGLVAAVHKYDGTVDKFVGDSLMAVFGAPIAHDNDPERAVCAALDMMAFLRDHSEKTGRKLDLAIGINAGALVAGSVGGHGRLNYSVVGETVTTALRLEGAASAGRIVVTKDVFSRAQDVVRFRALPPVRLKGKRNPIDVWEARERRPRSDGQSRGRGFIGRLVELDTLLAYAAAPTGKAVMVVGEAGAGRTSLMRRLTDGARAAGGQVVAVTCPPYGGERDAGLLTESIAELLKVRMDQGSGAIKDGKARLLELGLSDQEASLLLAGATREKVDTAALDYASTLRATCAAWLRVMGVSSGRTRLLVIFEDFQSSSATVKAQVEALLELPLPKGLGLVLSMRPEAADIARGQKLAKLILEPLSEDDARAMVADRLGLAVLDDKVAEHLFGITHGNPRMIEELLQSYIDQGVVFRSRQRWIVSPRFAEVAQPPSIERLVAARVDELEPDARRFLQSAAVVGTRFDPEMVRRVAGLQVDLEWVISLLVDRRMLVPDEGRRGLLRFQHETWRHVAAEGLPQKERQRIHMQTGQYLEETTDQRDPRALQATAYHLSSGPDHEKGARFLLKAARRLSEVHQVDSAVELLQKLVTLAAPNGYTNYDLSKCETELDEALYQLGMCALRKGQFDEADEKLQWAYGRARQFFNGDLRVWSLLGLSQLSHARARPPEARKFLEMAAVDAEGMRDPALLALSLLERARLFNAENDPVQALEAVSRALEAEKKITPELRAALPQGLSVALILLERGNAHHRSGNVREAHTAFVDAQQSASEGKDAFARGLASLSLGRLAAAAGDFAKAQEFSADALRCFRTVGDRVSEGKAIHSFALLELARGDRKRAAEAMTQAERIFGEIGHREGLSMVAQVRELLRSAGGG